MHEVGRHMGGLRAWSAGPWGTLVWWGHGDAIINVCAKLCAPLQGTKSIEYEMPDSVSASIAMHDPSGPSVGGASNT